MILTLGGSLIGIGATLWLAVSIALKSQNAQQLPVLLLMFSVFIALYALGIVAAIRFACNTQQRGWLRLYYALQIILIETPSLVLRFISGAYLIPTLGFAQKKLNVGFNFGLGSDWQFYIFTGSDGDGSIAWVLGINLVAIAVLWLLRK